VTSKQDVQPDMQFRAQTIVRSFAPMLQDNLIKVFSSLFSFTSPLFLHHHFLNLCCCTLTLQGHTVFLDHSNFPQVSSNLHTPYSYQDRVRPYYHLSPAIPLVSNMVSWVAGLLRSSVVLGGDITHV